jgi:hypothetical protein
MSLFIFMSYPSMIRHLNIKPYLLLLLLTLRLHATAQTPRELIATGLPLLEIVTDGLAVPTCEVVTAPVGCTGTSLSRNNGVSGCLCLTIGNRLAYASGSFVKGVSGMTIRRWGDSNGAFAKQHPYRLELESEADLLLRSDGDHSLLEAYDREREGWRTFRIDRIKGVEVLQECFDPKTPETRDTTTSALLLFMPGTLPEDWPDLKTVRTHEDGAIEARIPWYGSLWLPKKIIAHGKVQVQAPESLAHAVIAYARQLLQNQAH